MRTSEATEGISLIPMGAARLRLAAFPVAGDGPESHVWSSIVDRPVASASFTCPGDSVEAMNTDVEPTSSHESDIPRFTWWNHLGSTEWAQLTYAAPARFGRIDIYWFSDGAGCAPPASWRLLYRDGDRWNPVEEASGFGVGTDGFNHVTFSPVTTMSLRIEATLRPGKSAGILAWRCLPPDPAGPP